MGEVGDRSRDPWISSSLACYLLHYHAPKVKKWSVIELVWAITSTFMHGFENNLAQWFV